MNIEISNLPPMPFEADWEYTIGQLGENWKKSVEIGDVYHLSDGWRRTVSGDGWIVYARPKPEPAPEPEPEPEPYIDILINWGVYPTVRIEDIDGACVYRAAEIGLFHRQDGREYRLARFLYSDGTSFRFSIDDNIRGDIKATKATHARFYLVAE